MNIASNFNCVADAPLEKVVLRNLISRLMSADADNLHYAVVSKAVGPGCSTTAYCEDTNMLLRSTHTHSVKTFIKEVARQSRNVRMLSDNESYLTDEQEQTRWLQRVAADRKSA